LLVRVPVGAQIFDAETGKQLRALRHQHCVTPHLCVANHAVFRPDGSMIATTGWDATIGIFDAHTGHRLRVLRGHKPGGFGTVVVEWSRDGRHLLSTGHDGTRIWIHAPAANSSGFRPEAGLVGQARGALTTRVLTESGVGSKV
jgi:WD40 repeat protein